MITNQEIKLIQSLDKKSERINNGLFVVEGIKNIQELIQSRFEVFKIYGMGNYFVEHETFEKISEKELSRISHLKSANEALALAKIPSEIKALSATTTLVLDGVNDPGNLGTIIRTADWFGIKQIVCSPLSVDVYSPKVVMSTMGSIFRVSVFYQDLATFIANSNLTSYAAVLNGKPLHAVAFQKNALLVMGSESHGISQEIQRLCTHKITIEGGGATESLNLAIASGIICHAFHTVT